MPEKTAKLISAEEMQARLITVSSEPHLVRHLYPRFAEDAGREYDAINLVLALTFKISDYDKNDGRPGAQPMLLRLVPFFIPCLIDDEDVINEAQEIWKEETKAA